MIHAHIETYATDCDGPISRTYMLTMNDEERADDFGDITFVNRMVAHVVSAYSTFHGGNLTITNDDEYSVGKRLEWNEVTEEGHRNVVANICTDDCDDERPTYRDHRAEAMGY